MTEIRAVHVAISGRVQGVGYRAWLRDQATAAGLKGWVRNRRTGEVEAVLIGSADIVGRLVDLCWQGPDWARVDAVETTAANEADLAGFTVLATE
ncbi:MAG: acylphosphatase [Pseudomonadota bacterium]